MQVDFYHLTTTPLDRALPQIAEKVVATGNRLLIVTESDSQRAMLDRLLWTYAPESFLPHACTGSVDDSAQPILLSATTEASNTARHVALADGVWREEALTFDRAFHFFDSERIVEARTAWKSLGDRDGITRNYWKQTETGRWEKAA